jgi:elongation factor 1 alpha-like protein
VDIAITGLDPTAAFQGSVLCHPDFPVRLAVSFEARVLVLDVSVPLLKGAAVTVHAHTARESGVLSGLLALLDGKTGEVVRAKPRCLLKGQVSRREGKC